MGNLNAISNSETKYNNKSLLDKIKLNIELNFSQNRKGGIVAIQILNFDVVLDSLTKYVALLRQKHEFSSIFG